MRFLKGTHYQHPPRGPGRGRYYVSDAARRARRHNLSKSRLRSDGESRIMKLLIWESCFEVGQRPSQRVLARLLGVWPSYVHKVQKQVGTALDALASGQRATLDDLEKARRLTNRIREQEPSLLARVAQRSHSENPPVLTDDEIIAETWREVREWKRENLRYSRRRVLFSMPIR